MKQYILALFFFVFSAISYAQVDFGVKGGMAFGYNGTLKNTLTNIKESKGKDNIGWHAGVFSKIDLLAFFLQPEIYFSSMKTNFDSKTRGEFTTHSNRLDIPVLIGKDFLGITHVYAGPVFSTSINEGISLKGIKKTKTDDFSIGGQLGGGIDISRLTFDVRYEFGLNKSQTKFVNKYTKEEFKLEKRQNSLLVSIGYKF